MAELAIIMTIASAGMSAVGAIQQGNSQAAAAEYNAKIQERNAIIADQNRKQSLQQAVVDAEDERRDGKRTLAAMRAAYGSSGLELAGSPLDVLEDTALEQELNVRRIEASGYERNREGFAQITSAQERAVLDRRAGKSAQRAGSLKAGGFLAGGLASAGTALSRGA